MREEVSLGKKSGAHQKPADGSTPRFRRGVPRHVRRRPTRIGNADINAAEAGVTSRHKRSNYPGLNNIQCSMENFAACRFLNVRCSFLKRARCTRADTDTGAFAGKLLRDRASQSLAGSRNDGHASREPQIHSATSIKTSLGT